MKSSLRTGISVATTLFAFLAPAAWATPITLIFTGHVTDISINDKNGNVITDDPSASAIFNNVTLTNGNPYVVGSYTYDSDLTEWYGGKDFHSPNDINVTYQFSTEGIAFNKSSGLWGFDSFVNDGDSISSHIETSTLRNSGALWWNYSEFNFNFTDGNFTSGSFYLHTDQIPKEISPGYFMKGVIDQVFVTPSTAVPEPSQIALLLAGVVGIFAAKLRFRNRVSSSRLTFAS